MKRLKIKYISQVMKQKIYWLAVALATLWGCSRSGEVPTPTPAEKASFDLIQERLLTPSCATAGCHASAQDGSFAQHGLVLAAGKAYENLVGVSPQNTAALADGLLRVKPYKSLESLLYHKLNFDAAHHSGKPYGSPMPLGGKPLTVGQIEFVRRWIEAGAPRTGSVADARLLDDTTRSTQSVFTPLPVPPAGQGFQLHIERFEVAPRFEREFFVRKAVGNTQEVLVNRIQLKSRANSHHFVLYDFREKNLLPALGLIRDLRNPDNSVNALTFLQMQNHVFLSGGTDTNMDYTFPEGTAIALPANATLDLNPHYFNRTDAVLYGENYVNLLTTDKSRVQHVVKMLDLSNGDLVVPAGQRVTLSKSWTVSEAYNIVMLTSHNHQLGERFVIKIKGGPRNGQTVYESTDWQHPVIKNFSPVLRLEKGEGLTSEITYYNPGTSIVRAGFTSQDEMGIIFGYYYTD